MRDVAVTFHDEGIFMEQGRDVLRGHLPYLTHWDNAMPLQWLAFAIFMVLGGGTLTGFRLVAALYIGTTAYVLYRCMADRYKPRCAWWAGLFYIIFASTLQVGQSFTLEHVTALPFAMLLQLVLNGPAVPHKRHKMRVLLVFAVCSGLAPSFLWMLPGVVMLYPGLYAPAMSLRYGWKRYTAMAQPYAGRVTLLFSAAAAGYVLFGILYLLSGELGLYWASVMRASETVNGQAMPMASFFRQYFSKLVASNQWLMALLLGAFFIKGVLLALQQRVRSEPLVWRLLLLGGCAALMIYARGNHSNMFLFYILQALPVFALMMGYTINFNLADLRWFALVVTVVGLHNTTVPVQRQWGKLLAYAHGDNSQAAAYYGDRLYRVREVMATFPLEGETLVVCGEDDMMWELTGMANPRYFLFPFHHYNSLLQRTLGRFPPGIRVLVNDKKPLYILGREGDPLTQRGFVDMGDLLQQRYVQVANIEGTLIYLRRDKLTHIFTN